jgi:hypothetical protein
MGCVGRFLTSGRQPLLLRNRQPTSTPAAAPTITNHHGQRDPCSSGLWDGGAAAGGWGCPDGNSRATIGAAVDVLSAALFSAPWPFRGSSPPFLVPGVVAGWPQGFTGVGRSAGSSGWTFGTCGNPPPGGTSPGAGPRSMRSGGAIGGVCGTTTGTRPGCARHTAGPLIATATPAANNNIRPHFLHCMAKTSCPCDCRRDSILFSCAP